MPKTITINSHGGASTLTTAERARILRDAENPDYPQDWPCDALEMSLPDFEY